MNKPRTQSTPSANGLLQCLRLLAQEAASLNLLQTLTAIEDAVDAAAFETGMDGGGGPLQSGVLRRVIH